MNKIEYDNIIAFHPGYYVKDIIEDMDLTQEEFAIRLGTTPKNLSELLSGKIKLSTDLAMKLSRMLGTSVDVWINLEKSYEEKILEIENRKKLDEQIEIVKNIDYSYFTQFGLPNTKNSEEKINYLCAFFMISNLSILKKKDFLINYRTGISNINEKNVINSKAWVQTAINMGKQIETKNYDSEKLEESIPKIRALTVSEPNEFVPVLKEILSDCGVSFVLLPNLKNCGINGAVKWINNDKAILALNDRRSYADTFWFSLFHEIKHIFQHKTKTLIVSLEKKDLENLDEKLEIEADEFAKSTLIPYGDYKSFYQKGIFTEDEITKFANSINIHPGIVVGRLQKDKLIHFSCFNHLKRKYRIVCN